MSKSKRANTILEGEKLEQLYHWSGLTVEKFCSAFNRTRQWAHKAFKNEIIPMKDKVAICKAYNLPIEYFSGEHELPNRSSMMNEPSVDYVRASEIEQENNSLRMKLVERDQMVIELQQEVIRLMKELQ